MVELSSQLAKKIVIKVDAELCKKSLLVQLKRELARRLFIFEDEESIENIQ